jgi:uncharacterized protein YdhG (YjbR/CyaY superfamily)
LYELGPKDIDEYSSGFPKDVKNILQKIRATIRKAAPDAEETISYNRPTFNLNGRYLVYFAAYKKHIGFYPAPIGNEEFKEETLRRHFKFEGIFFELQMYTGREIIDFTSRQVRKIRKES